jgi:hypothetical protein
MSTTLANYNPEVAFGKVMNEYPFYDGKITLFYDDSEHSYSRFADGDYILIPGVTTVVHIIDKSNALTQWAANETTNYARFMWNELSADQKAELLADTARFEKWFNDTLEQARFNFKAISQTGMDIGSLAHNCLEDSIKYALKSTGGIVSEVLNLPELMEAANCVTAAMEWMHRHRVRWICTERKIYSLLYDYAGTMDGLAFVSSCNDPDCCPFHFENVLSLIDWKSSNRLYDEYRYQTAAYENAHEEEFHVDIKHRWVLRLGKTDGKFEAWHITESDFETDLQVFLDALALTRSIGAVKLRETLEKKRIKAERKAQKEAQKEADKVAKKAAKAAEREAIKALKEAEKAAKKKKVPAALTSFEDRVTVVTEIMKARNDVTVN